MEAEDTLEDKHARMREYGQVPLSVPVKLTLTEVPGIPAGANPFRHDHFNMGSDLVRGWMVMHEGFGSPDWPTNLSYLILVNTNTGQRFHIKIEEKVVAPTGA